MPAVVVFEAVKLAVVVLEAAFTPSPTAGDQGSEQGRGGDEVERAGADACDDQGAVEPKVVLKPLNVVLPPVLIGSGAPVPFSGSGSVE